MFYQIWEIKNSQIQEEKNGAIWFLDSQNIVLGTKIIILRALVQRYDPKHVSQQWRRT